MLLTGDRHRFRSNLTMRLTIFYAAGEFLIGAPWWMRSNFGRLMQEDLRRFHIISNNTVLTSQRGCIGYPLRGSTISVVLRFKISF
jgi:hypothetical protein